MVSIRWNPAARVTTICSAHPLAFDGADTDEAPARFRVRSILRALTRTQLHRSAALSQRSCADIKQSATWSSTPSPLCDRFPQDSVAGCLVHSAERWQEFCARPSIQDYLPATVVTFGLAMSPSQRVPRLRDPFQFARPQRLSQHQQWLDVMIPQWEQQGVIARISPEQARMVSPFFVVDKKHDPDAPIEKHFRAILDQRGLNLYYQWQRGAFHLEDVACLKDTLAHSQLRFGALIDIDSAYWQIPLAPEMASLMAFATHDRKLFTFQVMPFGLSIAPWVFCRMMKPILKHLRGQLLIDCAMYIDDLILLAPSRDSLEQKVQQVLELFRYLGIRVSPKSTLEPQEVLVFLGVQIDVPRHLLSTPETRLAQLDHIGRALTRRANASQFIPVRQLARFLGLLNSCHWGTRAVPFLTAPLLRWLSCHFNPQQDPFYRSSLEGDRKLGDALMHPLAHMRQLNCVPATYDESSIIELTTDASPSGYGGHTPNMSVGLPWDSHALALPQALKPEPVAWTEVASINELELRAVLLCLRHFLWALSGQCVRLVGDNQTALAYLRRVHGLHPHLSQIAFDIWDLCLRNSITLVMPPRYIRSEDNVMADDLSRAMQHTEWTTSAEAFQFMQEAFAVRVTYDRFASRENALVPQFDSWNDGRDALRATAESWRRHVNYVCCQFALLPRVLPLLESYQATAIVVAPLWPSAPFYPRLARLAAGRHVLLDPVHHFRGDPTYGHSEPAKALSGGWQIAAFFVSP